MLTHSSPIYLYHAHEDVNKNPMTFRLHKGVVEVIPQLEGKRVFSIASGENYSRPFTIVATSEGVYSWGDNSSGQLGIGMKDPTTPTPSPILIPIFSAITILKVAVSNATNTHEVHCAALSNRGNLFTWGRGKKYQLGTARSSNT